MGRTGRLHGSRACPCRSGSRAARDHERAHRSAAKRRGGVRRRRHVALDARVRGERPADAVRACTRRGHRLQAALAGVPVGIASFTDRVLPHLFPTVDQRVFRETMREAVGIERPPPSTSFGTNVTTLDALGAVPTLNFFTPGVKKRALVVFTDGDSQPVSSVLATDFAKRPRIDVTFVRMGDTSERIYSSGVAEAGYKPAPSSSAKLTRLRLQFAVVFSTKAGSTRQPPPYSSRSAPARPSVAASRAVGAR